MYLIRTNSGIRPERAQELAQEFFRNLLWDESVKVKKMDQTTTARGRFRSIEMHDLQTWAHSPLWDEEESRHLYLYPLLIDPAHATREGKRLIEGNELVEAYELGPYVCAKSSKSHIGPYRHAIDFIIPDRTPVVAALDGKVIEVQQHSKHGGPTLEYRDTLNYLTIEHAGGEYTQYCHLAFDSARAHGVRVGSRVKKGQRIATVGKTGWTDLDHLHFIVFRGAKNESPFTFKSLRIRFE